MIAKSTATPLALARLPPDSSPPCLRAGTAPSPGPSAATARVSQAAEASLFGGAAAGCCCCCLALLLAGPASAALVSPSLQLDEPANALSLPTWAVHVSSVVEWCVASDCTVSILFVREMSGYESSEGLSWGMILLLGGAFCACTWHFFYNSESLEVSVALQAALTVIGNTTMCFAAFCIYRTSEECRGKL
ncbi:hypothetical protein ACJRO7_026515 [Eucalyptus globulus]|uniref:Uncharacterized protein n=1 Tax=Eucalyptus globulus TaxID=34317 RepID=A0ABD3JT22_EUCGL